MRTFAIKARETLIRTGALYAALLLACDESPTPPNGEDPPASDIAVDLELVADELASPVYLTAPPGDPRLFIVEQPGTIRVIEDGELVGEPFLDLTDRVGADAPEQGLLSVAFHPEYDSNGVFFTYYTNLSGDTRVERFTADPGANTADRGTGEVILTLEQPYDNHNGGLMVFGPDGMLYIGLGDGGDGGDPHENGQNTGTLLGSILRLDVDGDDTYTIPDDNPFADEPGGEPAARGEIWAYGLRNPWRFSFDRETGLLYVADVGQRDWEEVNVSPGDEGGLNYGWNVMEGTHCFGASSCDESGLVQPVFEYDHGGGACSVTGGYVYRGEAIPDLLGTYFYADYCAGWIRSFRYQDGEVSDERQWDDLGVEDLGQITSFGEDAAGELYVVSQAGAVYRFVPE